MSSIDDNVNIELNDYQKDLIKSYIDDNGRLACIDAFIVANKAGIDVKMMSAATKSMDIRITDCELGVFGKLDFSQKDDAIYNNIIANFGGEKKLDCKTYWNEAKLTNLHQVGSTIKNSDLEVINCQLGCFRLKAGKKKR